MGRARLRAFCALGVHFARAFCALSARLRALSVYGYRVLPPTFCVSCAHFARTSSEFCARVACTLCVFCARLARISSALCAYFLRSLRVSRAHFRNVFRILCVLRVFCLCSARSLCVLRAHFARALRVPWSTCASPAPFLRLRPAPILRAPSVYFARISHIITARFPTLSAYLARNICPVCEHLARTLRIARGRFACTLRASVARAFMRTLRIKSAHFSCTFIACRS